MLLGKLLHHHHLSIAPQVTLPSGFFRAGEAVRFTRTTFLHAG